MGKFRSRATFCCLTPDPKQPPEKSYSRASVSQSETCNCMGTFCNSVHTAPCKRHQTTPWAGRTKPWNVVHLHSTPASSGRSAKKKGETFIPFHRPGKAGRKYSPHSSGRWGRNLALHHPRAPGDLGYFTYSWILGICGSDPPTPCRASRELWIPGLLGRVHSYPPAETGAGNRLRSARARCCHAPPPRRPLLQD